MNLDIQIQEINKIFKPNGKYFNYGNIKPVDNTSLKKEVLYTKLSIDKLNACLENHLKGTGIVGLIPNVNSTYCNYGVIDIDNYKNLNMDKIYAFSKKHGGFMFSSKSNGIHLYFFSSYEIEVFLMQQFLSNISVELNEYNIEIFPKQSYISSTGTGNSINLPFHNNANVGTYYKEGNFFTLQEFIKDYKTIDIFSFYNKENMDSNPVYVEASNTHSSIDNSIIDIPKCLLHLLNNFNPGVRNNTLLNLGVYLKLKYKEDYLKHVDFFYEKYLSAGGLSLSQVKSTLESYKDKDYFYQCNSFLKPYCIGKEKCRNSNVLGIGNNIKNEDKPTVELPFEINEITQIKYMENDYEYQILINNTHLVKSNSIKTLLSFKRFKIKVVEQVQELSALFLSTSIKDALWNEYLSQALAQRTFKDYSLESKEQYKDMFSKWIEENAVSNYENLDKESFLKAYKHEGVVYNNSKKELYFNPAVVRDSITNPKNLSTSMFERLRINFNNTCSRRKKHTLNVLVISYDRVDFTPPEVEG